MLFHTKLYALRIRKDDRSIGHHGFWTPCRIYMLSKQEQTLSGSAVIESNKEKEYLKKVKKREKKNIENMSVTRN